MHIHAIVNTYIGTYALSLSLSLSLGRLRGLVGSALNHISSPPPEFESQRGHI